MPEETPEYEPYVEQKPSDILTSEAWNRMQVLIKEDIRATAQDEIEKIEQVPKAEDSDKLGGRTPDELAEDLVKKVLDEVRSRSGYLQALRILKVGEDSWIEHDFGNCPLVDVYQLDYFPVICCEDKEEYPAWATFYLHHSSEKRLRYRVEDESGNKVSGTVEIVPRGGPDCCIPLADVLDRYGVPYTADTSLGDLETEMWRALFSSPNDEFDDAQYCHSIWFDKCCREEKSVRDLKKSGDWNELCLQMRPRKTLNYPGLTLGGERVANQGIEWRPVPTGDELTPETVLPAPTQVQVSQCGWNRVGLHLLAPAVYPQWLFKREALSEVYPDLKGFPLLDEQIPGVREELKVMVLLKC
jgi:hypothetical protein